MDVPTPVLLELVEQFEKTSAFNKRAMDEQKKIDERVPQVVDALVKSGFVDAANRDSAIKTMQADPMKSLECLEKLASLMPVTSKSPDSLGGVVATTAKTASQQTQKSESEQLWDRAFGEVKE